MNAVSALVRKDLRLELRTRESVPAMALFSVSTFVLFHFGLDARSLEGNLAAGVFWVTLLFASVLAVNRLFVAEREQGGFDGFLVAPPLLVPVVIAAAEATSPLLEAGGAGEFPVRWLAVLALYDAVFGLLAYAVFDFLLEE